MPTITKNISLEQFKTRFPVCFPSIAEDGSMAYMSYGGEIPISNQHTAHYNFIPLSVSSGVTSGFTFTTEMEEVYGYSGCTIPCHTLQEWLNGFISYFGTLRSVECREPYSSMTEYSESVYGYISDTASEADRTFLEHGGKEFYKWLIDNYFTLFDCWEELGELFKYEGIEDVVASIGCDRIPYPAAIELYGKMLQWQSKFPEGTDCSTTNECCDCEKYFSYGGEEMVQALSSWIQRIEKNIKYNDQLIQGNGVLRNDLIPRIGLNVPITGKMEDFGVFEVMAVDFVPGRTYSSGDTCLYNDELWICVSKNGYENEEFIVSDDNNTFWQTYFDYKIGEGQEVPMQSISGRTVSSLDSFISQEQATDNLGNALPGCFTPFSGSTVVQPPEGTLLEFMYMPGNVANETLVENNGGFTQNKYTGDYLQSITFFAKDTYGKVIDTTVNTSTTLDGIQTTPESAITDTIAAIESYSGYTDGKIYADFVYIKGTEYGYQTVSGTVVPVGSEPYLMCTDHCTVEEKTCQYFLSERESYTIKYYGVNMDIEEKFSEERQTTTDVCMCDFATVGGYNLESDKEFRPPLFRKEDRLWFSINENPKDNIYVDRGYATVLDRHLRIGEAFNYEQLAKYGNGMFQIFPADEDTI